MALTLGAASPWRQCQVTCRSGHRIRTSDQASVRSSVGGGKPGGQR
ncbi:hypothetical protein GQF42_14005 [Streptomyces broussonetiae]|uniref:Uncharacterized protein n=1 Tax=Streptomyces broussonetiae TaxID=2686304 RepID=A0A6I6N764_9ACTN|nr:hypothetical protein GQF42_14005 [Streptomyces broussonetiae]